MVAEVVDIEELGMLKDELTAIEEPPRSQPEPDKLVSPEPELPEKYRGKSIQEIVKMHQEAEKFAGRQAQEVGEIRQLADQLIKSQFKPAPVEVVPEIDFYSNPEEAVRQAVRNSPEVIEARNTTQQLRQMEAKRTLLTLHSDVGQVMSDPQFTEWVMGSKVRTKLFQQAEKYDVDAADELLSTFKELRKARQPEITPNVSDEIGRKERSQAIQAVAVESGGSGEVTRKSFRRADLIRLQIYNPTKYEAMRGEIEAAYAEGRVR